MKTNLSRKSLAVIAALPGTALAALAGPGGARGAAAGSRAAACVTRQTPQGWPKGGWEPQEKISMDDCLRGYTTGSAYVEFDEKIKGELKPGMLADIVVLSHDPRKIPPTELWQTKALLTIVGGRIVYDRMPPSESSH